MPVPFQIGLFLTVLVLAAVRFERSLREVLRSGAAAHHDVRSRFAQPLDETGGKGRTSPPREPPGTFNLGRWYHLAILWGLLFFCVPFLLAVAFPGRIMDVSKAADRALTGGVEGPAFDTAAPVDWEAPPLAARLSSPKSAEERRELEGSLDERTARARAELARTSEETALGLRRGVIGLGLALGVSLALGTALAVARRTRSPLLMTALGAVAFIGSAAGFAFAGPISSRLSAVERASRVIESYAAARTVRAEEAGLFAGPVKVVGRPSSVVGAESGYLYLKRPGEPGEGPASPHAGFRVGGVVVPPTGPGDLHVVLPHVRLGPRGREFFIREDEDVLAVGFVLSRGLAPRPGYPVIVAPVGAASIGKQGVFQAIAADLFGAERRHARYLVLLQLLFGALAAWFMTTFCSACSEHAIARRERSRARTDAPASGHLVDA